MKRTMKWSLEEGSLIATHLDEEDYYSRFDLDMLFPDFDTMTEVQQMLIAYGVKQKLADSCARSKEVSLNAFERHTQMNEVWHTLLTGKWKEAGKGKESLQKKISKAEAEAPESEVAKAVAVLRKAGIVK
jgi:hypothetical protein